MIVLTTTSQTLQAVLSASTSTTQLDSTAVFYDSLPQITERLQRFASQLANTLNTTDVAIVSAPAADGIARNITNLTIYNRDVTTATLTVKIDDAGSEKIQVKQTLAVGESLVYEHGTGWQIL